MQDNYDTMAEFEFALTPGRLRSQQIIDYLTESRRKLFKGAIEPLKNLQTYQQRTYVTFCSFSHSELIATIGMIFSRYPMTSKKSSSTSSSSMEV